MKKKLLLLLCAFSLLIHQPGFALNAFDPERGKFYPVFGSYTGSLSFPDGTSLLPSMTWTSDPDTGVYHYGTNSIGFTAGAVLQAQINGSGLHLVTPLELFSGGTGGTSAQSAADNILQISGATTNQVWTFDGSHGTWATPSGAYWDRASGATYPHTIGDSVGIGTTTPVGQLEVLSLTDVPTIYAKMASGQTTDGIDLYNNAGTKLWYVDKDGTQHGAGSGGTIFTLYGSSSGTTTFQASATASGSVTLPADTGTVALTPAATAVTVSSNAGTVPVATAGRTANYTFSNSSAANMTITMATSGAVNMQTAYLYIYDFSGVAKTISWVNTENSTVTAPATSNGSTTLPLSAVFKYNSSTSKWRCVGSA